MDKLTKFLIDANVNWLQYKIIQLLQVFNHTELCFSELHDLIKLGMCNNIYTACPRYCKGDDVIDIAPHLETDFKNLFGELAVWQQIILKNCLIGNYDVAYLTLEKIIN